MGVLNVTPDSFSDGGRFLSPDAAIAHAECLIAEGAEVIDIGGESTRPGAVPVPPDVEIDRVVPVIAAIRARSAIAISIDTMKPVVARAAVQAGATFWNDVTALGHDPGSLATAADLGCEVILMHMRGAPETMQRAPHYEDVVGEVMQYLRDRAEAALAAGVAREKIWLDPGLGFGKTTAHNLALLAQLPTLTAQGFPVLLGASRKGFIRACDPTAVEAWQRLGGSLAAALAGARAGVKMLRVHDVAATVQALAVTDAIERAGTGA
jgi:dihydropteroate synthase